MTKNVCIALFLFLCSTSFGQQGTNLSLVNDRIRMIWENSERGWLLKTIAIKKGNAWVNAPQPSGEHTLLYAAEKPSTQPDTIFKTITGVDFPEREYKYQTSRWAESTNGIALNTAGKAYHFLPSKGTKSGNAIRFIEETPVATISTLWSIDEKHHSDIIVHQTLAVKQKGYFSMATPTLSPVSESDLQWATVPGYFQGNYMQPNFVLAYAYGHGVPTLPVVYRERTASTLCPIITSKKGITFSVIPEPGLSRDPWAGNKNTHSDWTIGLSHKNRKSELSPTIYFPVLGEPKSELKPGDTLSFTFRFSLSGGDWFAALNHAIYDIFKFKDALALRSNKQSLTRRMERMHHYLTDPSTSMWNVEEFKNLKIGAQSYLGGVVGSDRDAMKNSDYGAMWMLSSLTNDPKITKDRLPYAVNFKLAQQQTDNGFFKGAAVGQYYLAKSKKFVEEWGEVVEPIGLTYYTMLDVGNILLFEPGNQKLKERLRLGAELLLKWQKDDGSWSVAYDRKNEKEVFKDIKDLRPTFYGLIVAYRILRDDKYLKAAIKGADWLIKNGVETGSFLGVCGDARYAPDFATAQTAQSFLDLYDITRSARYKDAAIATARMYTASIYTHPIASRETKNVHGTDREDWEIAQAGLSFEHGGIFGSANTQGPILLCSHAGLFIRMFKLTGDEIFKDMARAAAIGRDAFVDEKTSVASYYWYAMNRGAGPYPHHAWWQIGWITDYLMAEVEMRSQGKIVFPRGFVTPKVGPHQTYGFKSGKVFGQSAALQTAEGFVSANTPEIEYIVAVSPDGSKSYVIVLNDRGTPLEAKLSWGPVSDTFRKITVFDHLGKSTSNEKKLSDTNLRLGSYGLKVLVLEK